MNKGIILCVDDEKTILDSLKGQLKRKLGVADYFYELAENVEEAWEIIEDSVAHDLTIIVIVSDWLMPGVKGDEFLIQVHQKYPTITKIMLSGQIDSKALERVKNEANLYRFIAKPWDEDDLLNAIQSKLNNC